VDDELMQGKRADRVGALIQEEISRLIVRSVKDPRIGFVTVTRVKVSDDLRQAKIYVSPPQAAAPQRQDALMGLRSAAGFLRGELGRNLSLRYVPTLLFLLDDSLEEELHLAALFRKIENDQAKGD
jgi:ribosome-binding factor A